MPKFLSSPRSAYLHVPFCARRCGYCNFAVVAGRDDLVEDYLRAIAIELGWLGTPRKMDTLYMGGGTPSQLSLEATERLLRLTQDWLPGAAGCEWTVEANPGDVTKAWIAQLAKAGVTRLSLGAQSFRKEKLLALERDHHPCDTARAVDLAKQAGMEVAIDLIFAAPDETIDDWRSDLGQALALMPDHVSTYGLTYEKGAAFWGRRARGLLTEAHEELARQMYEWAIDQISEAGLEHYEISNFATAGRRSRHNEAYWLGCEYLAAGPGAARHVAGTRETNHRSTTTYLRRVLEGRSPVAERETLSAEQRARERLVFGLRRLEGVSRSDFRSSADFEIDELAREPIRRFVELGLLKEVADRLRLTREGLLVSDALWPELL